MTPSRPSPDRSPSDTSGRASAGRETDRERATALVAGQLVERGVELAGDEDGDALATLLSAVETFDTAVARRGGDSMTNAPDSRNPENKEFVLPRRKRGEAVEAYTERVLQAAGKLQ